MLIQTPRFSGFTAFIYHESKDCRWMSRRELLELMMGGRRNGTDVTINRDLGSIREGDVVTFKTAGKGSRNLDTLLRDGLNRATYDPKDIVIRERALKRLQKKQPNPPASSE